MGADLARFRAGEPVAARPETRIERAARSAWAYRAAIGLVLAYLAMRVIVALVAG